MNKLVELTIDYYDGNTETMVVTKESNAYMTMLEYAKQNDYAIDEKPYFDEKIMPWALRGILSTNQWEEIDWLVNLHDECKQYPHVDEDGLKDIMFECIEKADQFIRNQVWQAIMENINA